MSIGQAYQEYLTPLEQKGLKFGCALLIDKVFDDLKYIENPENVRFTTLELHLPERYLMHHSPLFCKQFLVCIITVAWKLAQPQRLLLSSLAEELAAWAILTEARAWIELNIDRTVAEEVYEVFIQEFFEDLDFEYLFDDAYDGVDESPIGEVLGITSLKIEDWFRPFSDESSRIAHPYVLEE